MKKVLTGILILLLIVLGLAWIKNSERNVAGKIKQFASDTGQKIVDVTQDAAKRIENGANELASNDELGEASEEAAEVTDESLEQAADKVKMALLQEEQDIEAATNELKKQVVADAKDIQVQAEDELDKESERARASIDKLLTTKIAPKPAIKDDSLPAAEQMMISKKGDENVKLVPIGKSADPVAAAVAKADKVAPVKQESPEAKEEIQKVAKIEKPKEVQQAVAALEKEKSESVVPAKLAQKKKPQVAMKKKTVGPSWISFQSPRKKLVVNYSPDSYQLTDATRKALDAYIAVVKERPLRTLRVVGHSEKTGSVLEERKMSYLRTRQIVEYLITQGIEPSSIHSDHLGSKLPLASNATENGKTRNRRVEVHVRQN